MGEEIEVTEGTIRTLTKEEKENHQTPYKWAVVHPYTYKCGDRSITVREGFLTDGATGGPDFGGSWVFHDYLYASHQFDDGEACSRVEADQVMQNVLTKEREEDAVICATYAGCFRLGVSQISYWNPFWCFTRAWNSSGARGPEYSHVFENGQNRDFGRRRSI